MTTTQVSFSAFAHSRRTPAPFTASDQRCLLCGKPSASCECTPPASTPVVPALVAQAPGSGGECTLRPPSESFVLTVAWGDGARRTCRTFRYFSRAVALSQLRDFPSASAVVVTRELGYATVSGWVPAGAAA